MILSREPDILVKGDAGTGHEALPQIRRLRPDVVICDINLPDSGAMQILPRLAEHAGQGPRMVILSELEEGPWPRRVLQAGACGFIALGSEVRDLLRAVREASLGRRYLGRSIANRLALEAARGQETPFDALSAREMEVAWLLVQGLRHKEVAARLGINAKTVATYKARVRAKLGIRHNVALVRMAQQYGWAEEGAVLPSRGR
ncbi:response regulator transcription factor [Acidovorax sp. SUPP2825]|nr:response regulator transcription factor [Acidovorax sp. SUPP2825]